MADEVESLRAYATVRPSGTVLTTVRYVLGCARLVQIKIADLTSALSAALSSSLGSCMTNQ